MQQSMSKLGLGPVAEAMAAELVSDTGWQASAADLRN